MKKFHARGKQTPSVYTKTIIHLSVGAVAQVEWAPLRWIIVLFDLVPSDDILSLSILINRHLLKGNDQRFQFLFPPYDF